MPLKVIVSRTETRYCTIEVDTDNHDEAREKALELAYDVDYRNKPSKEVEYNVIGIV